MPEPDCFLRYRISAGTRNFASGKSDVYVLAAAEMHGFTMPLFTEPVSRRNTFVGGTCAPPSALLVSNSFVTFNIHVLCLCIIITYLDQGSAVIAYLPHTTVTFTNVFLACMFVAGSAAQR